MDHEDIQRIVKSYGAAALRCKEGGLDGCEVVGHGHLLEQFWSPSSNWRTDEFGGSLENRLRFGLMVLEEIRHQVRNLMSGLSFVDNSGIWVVPVDVGLG